MSAILDKTICLTVSFSAFGVNKKIPKSLMRVDADVERIRGGKKLLMAKEYDAIVSADGQLRQWLDAQSVPAPLFARGVYAVPLDMVTKVQKRLDDFTQERKQLVDALIDAYPAIKARDEAELRSVYNPLEYPPPDELRRAFGVRYAWIEFRTPGKLVDVSAQLDAENREKFAAALRDAEVEVREALRAAWAALVDHAVDRLTAPPGGKPPIFRDSMIEKITEFLDTFSARNITNDEELARLVSQARELVAGVDPEAVRRNPALREAMARRFADVQAALTDMVEPAPRRRRVRLVE